MATTNQVAANPLSAGYMAGTATIQIALDDGTSHVATSYLDDYDGDTTYATYIEHLEWLLRTIRNGLDPSEAPE